MKFATRARTWRVACMSASWRSFMLAITSITRRSNLSHVSTYNCQLTLHTDSHASYSGAVRQEWRTIFGAKFKLLYSEIALSRKPFRIGHTYIYTFSLRMTDTMTSQNIDISSWVICISLLVDRSHAEQTGTIYHNSTNRLLGLELWAWVHLS